MAWQDLVLVSGQLVLIASLFPSILSKNKPALLTSVSTGVVLVIFSFTYMSLNLWLTAFGTIVIGGLWFLLAYQKYKGGRR